jgi:hypothetical protein
MDDKFCKMRGSAFVLHEGGGRAIEMGYEKKPANIIMDYLKSKAGIASGREMNDCTEYTEMPRRGSNGIIFEALTRAGLFSDDHDEPNYWCDDGPCESCCWDDDEPDGSDYCYKEEYDILA